MNYCIKSLLSETFNRPDFQQIEIAELDHLDSVDDVYIGDALARMDSPLGCLVDLYEKVDIDSYVYIEFYDIYELALQLNDGFIQLPEFNKIMYQSGYKRILDIDNITEVINEAKFTIIREDRDAGKFLLVLKKENE